VSVAEEGSTVFKKAGGVAILIFGKACTPVSESDTADQCLTKAPSAHVPARRSCSLGSASQTSNLTSIFDSMPCN
jgi:hypothetical protein